MSRWIDRMCYPLYLLSTALWLLYEISNPILLCHQTLRNWSIGLAWVQCSINCQTHSDRMCEIQPEVQWVDNPKKAIARLSVKMHEMCRNLHHCVKNKSDKISKMFVYLYSPILQRCTSTLFCCAVDRMVHLPWLTLTDCFTCLRSRTHSRPMVSGCAHDCIT